ncbi:hypothetical protein [Pseudomonas syringae]|uniref:hypothetical protein n=1 Tax=Pseudomonas syringae TaxID=317 RepID=UPI003204E3D2
MKIALGKTELLKIANEELKKESWYEDGLEIKDAEMKGHVLVMGADGMLTDSGIKAYLLPKFDEFAKSFADRYTLM